MGENIQTQQGAWAGYESLLKDPRSVFLQEPSGLDDRFYLLTNRNQSLHRQWTDSYLAAFADSASLSLVTFDRNFKRIAGLHLELLTLD